MMKIRKRTESWKKKVNRGLMQNDTESSLFGGSEFKTAQSRFTWIRVGEDGLYCAGDVSRSACSSTEGAGHAKWIPVSKKYILGENITPSPTISL